MAKELDKAAIRDLWNFIVDNDLVTIDADQKIVGCNGQFVHAAKWLYDNGFDVKKELDKLTELGIFCDCQFLSFFAPGEEL